VLALAITMPWALTRAAGVCVLCWRLLLLPIGFCFATCLRQGYDKAGKAATHRLWSRCWLACMSINVDWAGETWYFYRYDGLGSAGVDFWNPFSRPLVTPFSKSDFYKN